MKKLLSAVTSVAMGASLMSSVFASSLTVSAAGSIPAAQPNVSMGGALGAANKTADDVATDFIVDPGEYTVAPDAEWVIPTVEAKPGEKVKMNVVVNGTGLALSGAQFNITADSPIAFAGVNEKSAAYNSVIKNNAKTNEFAFGESKGAAVTAKDGSIVLTLTYDVPLDIEPGKYPVSWSEAFISDTDGLEITDSLKLTDGAIIVADGEEPAKGEAEWVIPTVKAKPGDKVEMNVTVKNSDLAIAGAQFDITADSPIKFSGASENTSAYASVLKSNGKTNEFAFGEGNGTGVVAKNGSTVLTLTYEVPEDAKPGKYPVEWSEAFISDANGREITENLKLTNGAIIVGEEVGEAEWVIPTVKAKPGEKVEMNVLVKNSDLAVAGAQFDITADSPIKFSSVSESSSAYGSGIKNNPETNEFAFGHGKGAGVVAEDGDIVLTLTYEVPKDIKPGEYPVAWSEAFISDTDGSDITSSLKLTDGAIIIEDEEEGEAEWVIPTVKAKPGEKVEMNVLVKGSDLAVAGAQFNIEAASPIKFNSASETSAAYASVLKSNAETNEFAFGNGKGAGVVAKDGDVVLTLTYEVPEGTKAGEYPVSWSNAFISNTNGSEITKNLKLTDGAIIIEDEEETGEAEWVIPKVKAKPGDKVEMDVLVKGSDLAVAGAQFNIEAASPIKFAGASENSVAYASVLKSNGKTNEFAFGNGKGAGVVAKDGDVVLTLTYEVPTDAEAGEYPVSWSNAFISNTNGSEITKNVKLTDGAIIIEEVPVSDETATWEIDTVHAKPGETVELPVIVKDTTGLEVAGAQFGISAQSPIGFSSVSKTSAYGADIVNNPATDEFAFGNSKGAAKAAAKGENVLVLTYKVPEDAKPGEYPVVWGGDVFISDTNGKSITSNVTLIDGAIIIDDEVVEAEEGDITWTIPEVEAAPGDTVEMTVKVNVGTKNLGVSGAQFVIDAAEPIEFVSVNGSSAYGSDIVNNPATDEFAFGQSVGKGIRAEDGSTVLTLTYKVPEDTKAGKYPVTWSSEFASDTNGLDITKSIKFVDGAIIIKEVTTTTTTSATTSTTADTTTTTASTSSSKTTSTTTVTTVDTTTTTVTTTTVPVQDGAIIWQGEKVEARPGEKVTVSFLVKDPKDAKLSVSGAQFKVNVEDSIKFVSAEGSEAYKATFKPNGATNEFAFANGAGKAVVGPDGSIVFKITYQVPEDIADGEYPVTISDLFATDQNELDISKNIITLDGAIIVKRPVTTTTTTEAPVTTTTVVTTTEAPKTAPKGAVLWEIGKVKAAPGETVTVPVKVVDSNGSKLPIGGAQFSIKQTAPIEYKGKAGSDAYGADIINNPATYEFAFANAKGAGVAAADGANVLTLTYVVPEDCEGGIYPVIFDGSAFISSEDGLDITSQVLLENGYIEVIPVTTTTTTGATTTTTDVTTTTTTGDKPVVTTTTGEEPAVTTTTTGEEPTVVTTTTTGEEPVVTTTTGDEPVVTTTTGDKPVVTTTTSGEVVTTTTTTGNVQPGGETTTTTTGKIDSGDDIPEGNIAWKLDEVTGAPGETVKLTMVVLDPHTTHMMIAGGQFDLSVGGGITVKSASGTPYSAKLIYNPETGEFAFANGKGAGIASVHEAVLMTIDYTIPEDCAAGDYPVTFSELVAMDGTAVDVTGSVVGIDGMIHVVAPVTTTTTDDKPVVTTTTTTGEEPVVTTTTTGEEPVVTTTTTGDEPVVTTTTTGEEPVVTTTTTTGEEPVVTTTTTTGEEPVVTTTTTTGEEPVVTTTTTGEEPVVTTTTTTGEEPVVTTTTTTGEEPVTTTTTTDEEPVVTTTTTVPVDTSIYAEYTTVNGFYFSHDPNTFNIGHVENLKLFNAKGEAVEVDNSKITFADAANGANNPMDAFTEPQFGDVITYETYAHKINVLYDGKQLTDKDGNAIQFTAYIGVKGDSDLDASVTSGDASNVLAYYSKMSTSKETDIRFTSIVNELVNEHPDLDEFCAFLADVDHDVYDLDNWNTFKDKREILADDASAILAYYVEMSTSSHGNRQIGWNKAIVGREEKITPFLQK